MIIPVSIPIDLRARFLVDFLQMGQGMRKVDVARVDLSPVTKSTASRATRNARSLRRGDLGCDAMSGFENLG